MSDSSWNLRYLLRQFVPPVAVSVKRALQPPQMVEKDIFDQRLTFSSDWFSKVEPIWDRILDDLQPSRVLEIGSFEGMSACYLIQNIAFKRPLEIHCVDTWEGGIEHQPDGAAPVKMGIVESRFHENTSKCVESAAHPVDLRVHKLLSHHALARMLASGSDESFDFIYIDGSHQAPDVLADAVLSFKLLRVGGILAFDDYLWEEPLPGGTDPLRCPKPAVDAFVNIHIRKLKLLNAPLGQLYVRKISA